MLDRILPCTYKM